MNITYEQIIKDSKKLAELIPKGKYKAIHGIPAGGIATAVTMARELGITNILSTEDYKHYDNKADVLVVDDLVDSGKTLERYPQSDCAVCYKKPHSPEPDYYVEDMGSEWITFPHEKDKDGILDHVIRVFSFIGIQLNEKEEEVVIDILNKIKK